MNSKHTYYLGNAQAAYLVIALFVFLFILLKNINSGYELGDHGFYLLHVHQPEAITHTVTHFGLVWNFLIGEHSIASNRLANIFVITLSGIALVLAASLVVRQQLEMLRVVKGVFVAAAAASTYFASFILDPSYNAIALTLVLFGVALIATGIEMELRGRKAMALALAGIVGALIAMLVLTKASTAISFSIFILIVSSNMAVALRSASLFVSFLVAGVLGSGVFLAFFQLFTGMLPHIVESFRNGLRVYSIGGAHSTNLLGIESFKQLYDFFSGSLSTMRHDGWMVALPALLALATLTPPARRLSGQTRFIILAAAVATISVLGIVLILSNVGSSTIKDHMITVFTLGILVSIAFWPFANLSFSGHVLVAGSFVAPLIIIFGTVNSYEIQILYIGTGLSLIPAWIVLSAVAEHVAAPARTVVLALAGFVVILSAYSATHDPYRLAGDLASARVTTMFPDEERMNVTPPVAELVEVMKSHSYAGPEAEAPTIFDLTGQLPIAVHLLNGRTPGAAWFLDYFGPGFSRAIFAELDNSVFVNGWVLVRHDETGAADQNAPHFRMFLERLDGLGIVFEEQFERVATVSAPNWGRSDETFTVTLFKPESLDAAKNGVPSSR